MTTTRESSTETADRYTFGYTTELSSNHESSLCTAKRLRQRLQRQQSGQSGRRYTGESSECSSLVGTPTESGRCFTFTAAQRILRNEERKPSVNQNLSEMLLDAIHMDDVNLVDRLLLSHSSSKMLSTSPSIGSTNTFTDLAQRRHGATNTHRRSNASSTVSTHSGGRSNCAVASTLHMAVAHKQRDIVELLLKSGYDANMVAQCHCKGNCTTTGNISLSTVLPRGHSSTPEMCSICSHLRVVSIIDQSPLGVAVRAQSPEMIAILVNYGADVNAADEDGNTPLMLAVKESPISWQSLHMLVTFGARILQKNTRGVCPLDLVPELRKLQETCIENLFHNACSPPTPSSVMMAVAAAAAAGQAPVVGANGIGGNMMDREEAGSSGGGSIQPMGASAYTAHDRMTKAAGMINVTKHSKKLHGDNESLLLPASFYERASLSKAPLSPRTSTAPSVSTCSMMESLLVNKEKDGTRRKSFVSLQLHRRSKVSKESSLFDGIGWEQAWEMLQKMAGNPECIEIIIRCLHKASPQMEDATLLAEKDAMDSHLAGLLHQILLTCTGEFQLQNAHAFHQRANKRRYIGILVSMVNFCYLCLQKSGSCRQFAALSTLNKIIDAGLVNSLFILPELTFHSSRLLNRSHEFHTYEYDDDASPTGVAGNAPPGIYFDSFDGPHSSSQATTHRNSSSDATGSFFQRGSSVINTHIFDNNSARRRETSESTNTPALILHSFYRKYGVHTVNTNTVKMGDLLKAFSSLQPAIVIACLHNAITMQNREAGARSVCSPAHRWRQCYFHCTQILAARFLLFLTSFHEFRHRLSERSQLKTLVQLLEPTLDPQLLCLLLQTIAILAVDPEITDLLIKIQIDDALIQMLLPADDWYYTNHSTKFGHFVKHHAARILVYIGLGDRVGNRVNLFQPFENLSQNSDPRKSNSSPNEDEYIFETLKTPYMMQEFSKTSMSVEGILQKILTDLSKNAISSKTGNGGSGSGNGADENNPGHNSHNSPTIYKTPPAGCIIEECESKPESPIPPSMSPRPITPNAVTTTIDNKTLKDNEKQSDYSNIENSNGENDGRPQSVGFQNRQSEDGPDKQREVESIEQTEVIDETEISFAVDDRRRVTVVKATDISLYKQRVIEGTCQVDEPVTNERKDVASSTKDNAPPTKDSDIPNIPRGIPDTTVQASTTFSTSTTAASRTAISSNTTPHTPLYQQQQYLLPVAASRSSIRDSSSKTNAINGTTINAKDKEKDNGQQQEQQPGSTEGTKKEVSKTDSDPVPTPNEFSELAAAVSKAVAGFNLGNLEGHLWKFSMILDSMLLLRLLLHKISWDLSLVAKRRIVAAATAIIEGGSHRHAALGANNSAAGASSIGSAGSAATASASGVASGSALGGGGSTSTHMNESRAYSSCSLGNSFYNRHFGKSKSFDRREEHSMKSKDKRFLRVDQGSRLSKRVHIRRSSSVEIPRPKRFSSGAKELRKERRRRLGTDTSSGSSKSKKTISSTSSVQKHLPKYIQSLFRGRMGTDPCKRHTRGDSSPDSNTSGSDAVLEFAKKLQNIPQTRRDTMRQAYKNSGHQDSTGTNSEQKARSLGYSYLPEVEVNGASPPRSPSATNNGIFTVDGQRRPSSPQAIPGLPLIEIRRPSAMSQFEFGYFINSPDAVSSGSNVPDSDCAPLLLSGGNGVQSGSRKSSDESSMCGWSSRASSAMSQRSSSGGLRLSTFSGGTSIASDNSGPFLFSFVLRKRASTIGTRIPLPKRAISRSSGDSLRVPDRDSPLHLMSVNEMSPDFQCIRQLLLNLFCMYTNKNSHFVGTLRWCSDVLRQILNSPQHPTVKNWCADIMNVVNAQLDMSEDSKLECEERLNDEYLDLQEQVLSGSLPCPREEAALMAAIQLCVEENWPSNKRNQTIRRHLIKGQFEREMSQHGSKKYRRRLCECPPKFVLTILGHIHDLTQKVMVTPWEADQSLYCTPPRVVNDAMTSAGTMRPTPAICANQQKQQSSASQQQQPGTLVSQQQGQQSQQQLQVAGRRQRRSLSFFNCISEPDPSMSLDMQIQCLPVDMRGDRRAIKLIRERKRKLFHSHIYESEAGMKKLYIQTAKKLPAYGCKVFQVKELLHGRTLRKTFRLLCLSSSVICLLDSSSKTVLKRQHAVTLQQWRVGGGISKHQLLLEFRGTKWQLIAPSYGLLRSISITLWEIMQNRANVSVQRSFNRSARTSIAFFDASRTTAQSSRTNSYSSATSSVREGSFCSGEPITLFRLELERLQYILHFPEEVAFQLSMTEYQLFYGIPPIDFIRYVGCDLASIPIAENPSPVRNLVKRLSEVSSWITHVIISQPTHEERKNCLAAITRVIDTCWNIGNFNGAVEILMGLKSTKLRPFWLSLKHEERQRYEEFVDILLPNGDSATPHPLYLETIQRALRMPQCRVIPFFGTFLRDLYAIVNDIPNVVVIGNSGEKDKLKFLSDINGDDHFSSNIGVGGLLNTDKINLIGIIIDNLEVFHNHHKQLMRYVESPALLVENASVSEQICQNQQQKDDNKEQKPQQVQQPPLEIKMYEPVQPVAGSSHGVTLIPLNSANFDLDLIQRLQHGTTVIHYDLDSGRSVLCRLVLDASCSTISWHRSYYGGRDGREKESTSTLKTTCNMPNMSDKYTTQYASSCAQQPPSGSRPFALDDGFIRTTSIKSVESVDSYDLDIEAIYKRHSVEEMSVPVNCWTINFGCTLNENEFLYFLAPQQIAQYWTISLQKIVKCIQNQNRNPDRRVMWLKKLYLQLYNESERDESKRGGPRPVEALQAFGGRVEKWKNFGANQSIPSNPRPTESSSSTEGGGTKSRFKQMTIAVTRRVKGTSRDCSRSQSPQPQSPLVRPPSIRSQLSSQSGPPGPNSPGFLLKPRGGGNAPPPPTIAAGGTSVSVSGGTTCVSVMGGDLTAAFSDAGDLDSLYTPRSRTPTSSSYGGRSVGGRSIKSWRSRGGETPNSGSISSSGQVSGLHGVSGKEYQEKPVSFTEFLELFRLFSTRMRKDLKDLFNDCIHSSSANSHVSKRAADRDKNSPRLQSRLESLSGPSPTPSEFVPDDALTRNSSAHLCHLNDKQQKIYNALALASVNSAGFMDTSRNTALSVSALKQFFCVHQMEQVDDTYIYRLIHEHEPDPLFRSKQLMSFEGFVRYLSDPINFAFVPEDIEMSPEQLQYPLSYYYISCSHNTYLTGHQLKGESSAEMYRQVLQTGCRCVELDCWDGDDGLPLIYHGHTFTTKISFRQVVDIIKKSAFETSNLPLILSIENHCSLQQQAKMAQMFKTAFGEKLVTNFLFDCDYSDTPRLPTPWQLRNRILIKNKKMTVEPYPGLYYNDKTVNTADTQSNIYRKHSRSSYDSSTIDDVDDDLDEFLDEEEPDTDDVDDTGESPTAKGAVAKRGSSSRRRSSKDSISSFVSDHTTPNTRRSRKSGGLHAPLDRKSTGDDEAFTSGVVNPTLNVTGSVSVVNGLPGNTTGGAITPAIGSSTPRRAQAALSRLPTGHQIAAELSELIIYTQAVKFKGFVMNNDGNNFTEMTSSPLNAATSSGVGSDYGDHRSFSNSFTTPKMRSQAHSLLSSGPPPRRQKSSSQISTTDSMKSGDNNNDLSTSGLPAGAQLSPGAANFLPSSSGSTNSATQSVIAAAAAAVAANSSSTANASSGPSGNAVNTANTSPNALAGRAPPPNASASCYQVSSITEASARKLCRKHPQKCIAYTQNHIMRTYPGGMRIDSSNFNPHRLVEFWECGLQMVALNYQTPDVAMHVNTAMFEQFGNCGYMLKPRALWDPTHPLYGRFNPMLKNQNGEGSAILLQLTVISGQYVCPGVFTASPFLEIEIIGVSADCVKHKSKIIGRNSVNPQWNHTVEFRINFIGLAFLRIAVCDGTANGRVLSQRVVPVRCLRPGYRHLPLRSPTNQPLEQSTLFIRSRFEQEERIYLHDEDILLHNSNNGPNLPYSNINTRNNTSQESELAYQILKIDPEANIRPLSILRKQIFVLRIVGLFPDETPTIVHAESGSTVRQVIQAALSNCGKMSENADDFALFEESVLCSTPSPLFDISASSCLASGSTMNLSTVQTANDFHDTSSAIVTLDSPSTATKMSGNGAGPMVKGRELPHNEPIMDAVACWNGSTRRFYLRKKSTDPSNRTWITSIIKSSGTNTMGSSTGAGGIGGGYPSGTSSLSGFIPTGNAAQSSPGGGAFSVQLRRGITPSHHIYTHGNPILHSAVSAVLESPRTPKSHSSTQLHGHSLDVEPTGSSACSEHLNPAGIHPRAKSMGETFLVCIHNVSDNHSYAILRTSIDNTARDIIKQIFAKTQRYDTNEDDYAIIEELYDTVACVSEPTTTRHFGGKISVDSLATTASVSSQKKPTPIYRILDANENIWKTQTHWQTQGRFILERRDRLAKFEKKHCLLNMSSDSNQSLTVGNVHGGTSGGGGSVTPSHHRDAPRKISLSNMRSIGFTRRFSRFGKSMTLDASRAKEN